MKSTLKGLWALAALFLLSFTLHAGTSGHWSATEQQNGRIQMNLRYGNSNHGNWFPIADFSGLRAEQIRSANGPVEFSLQREAGTVTFSGVFSNGAGEGQFRFQPDPAFTGRLQAAGVDMTGRDGRPVSESKLLSMALLDVTSGLARELQALGFSDISLNSLISVRIHGATPDFIRDMRAAGYGTITLKDAVTFRIHGVTPEFAREVRSAGITASSQDLVSMRIHGATVEWMREFRNLGYQTTDVNEFISMRIHGVTPEFVREIERLGYRDVPTRDLVAMRIHGVTPEFIRAAQAGSQDSLSIRQLISMRIHGLDPSDNSRRR